MTSVTSEAEMIAIGHRMGGLFRGGEVVELVGDVGAGKTTLVKGIGKGLQVDDDIQSPSFTISRVYGAHDGLELHHYDFYRLQDAGVMQYELAESIDDPKAVTIIEWADTVQDVLPTDRCQIQIRYTPDGNGRELELKLSDSLSYLGGAV